MQPKKLGAIGVVGTILVTACAVTLYISGRPVYAALWGAMALVWAGCSVAIFWTARKKSQSR